MPLPLGEVAEHSEDGEGPVSSIPPLKLQNTLYFIPTFLYAKGPGKISISSPRPPGDPLPQLKRSLREGVRDGEDEIVRYFNSEILLKSVFLVLSKILFYYV